MSRSFCCSYLCWMLNVKQPRFSFSIANCFYPVPGDSFDKLRIGHAGLPGGLGEVFVGSEMRIWVRLDEINFVRGCHAKIDARVTVDGQQAVNLFTHVLGY